LIDCDGYDYLQAGMTGAQILAALQAQAYYSRFGFNTNSLSVGTGAFGIGLCLIPAGGVGGNDVDIYKALPATVGDGYVFGQRIKLTATGPAAVLYLLSTADGTTDLAVSFTALGGISATIGTQTFNTPLAIWKVGVWFYMEIVFGTVGGTPTFTIKVNGDVIITAQPSRGPGPIDTVRWGGNGWQLDDYYVLATDDTGLVDPLGNIRVGTVNPGANGDVIGMTPTGADTNWQAAINPLLSSTIYNSTDTVGVYDLYDLAASVPARDVFAIKVSGGYAQDNSVQLYAKNKIKTGGTEYDGAQHGVASQVLSIQSDIWEKNPNTGENWTYTELNTDLQIGGALAASD